MKTGASGRRGHIHSLALPQRGGEAMVRRAHPPQPTVFWNTTLDGLVHLTPYRACDYPNLLHEITELIRIERLRTV